MLLLFLFAFCKFQKFWVGRTTVNKEISEISQEVEFLCDFADSGWRRTILPYMFLLYFGFAARIELNTLWMWAFRLKYGRAFWAVHVYSVCKGSYSASAKFTGNGQPNIIFRPTHWYLSKQLHIYFLKTSIFLLKVCN